MYCPALTAPRAKRPSNPTIISPIVSYLLLRGRCRSCHIPISWRYPAVEALTALLFGLVYLRDGLTLALPFDLIFVSALLALIFIDAEHMILPDAITLKGVVLAVMARTVVPNLDGLGAITSLYFAAWPEWAISLFGAGLGALVGGGSLWLTGWTWERLRGVEAMGFGDVKMMLMVGAYLGWRLTVLTIFAAVITGSVVGVSVMLWRGERDLQMRLPFGIFLGAGCDLQFAVRRMGHAHDESDSRSGARMRNVTDTEFLAEILWGSVTKVGFGWASRFCWAFFC
ncbi:MAG: prepilin peptidase [Pyrinomonadaceae bacterium]